jgi:glycosyltransferase involved in cell wall biosynthesis
VRVLAEHSTGERDMTRVRHLVNRSLAPLTTAWVGLARGQLDYLVRGKGIPRERIRIIPNGIDPLPFDRPGARARIRRELGLAEDAAVAGILAVLRPEKDHRNFLLAARFVADELPAARFLVVGDGPLAAELRREISALGLAERVVLAGRRGDVPDVLAAFDVSVLCSTDVETLPLAFLESMAAGLPLVGTRVGGIPDLVAEEENGLLVEPRDPRSLAGAMLRILRDPALARSWGRRSRDRVVSRFGIDDMVRAYEALFEELLRDAGVALPAAS